MAVHHLGCQSCRWSDLDFEANLREGIAVDWPIRYQDIPWYDYVEISSASAAKPRDSRSFPTENFCRPWK